MCLVGLIFEPHPQFFQKLHIFQRSSNEITTIFENFFPSQTQKNASQLWHPGPVIHDLGNSLQMRIYKLLTFLPLITIRINIRGLTFLGRFFIDLLNRCSYVRRQVRRLRRQCGGTQQRLSSNSFSFFEEIWNKRETYCNSCITLCRSLVQSAQICKISQIAGILGLSIEVPLRLRTSFLQFNQGNVIF